MDTEYQDLTKHISQQYNAELEDLRNRVMAMGRLVEHQIRQALLALMNGDTRLAEQVIGRDNEVDAMEVLIDEESAHIIATRQPAASDLRLILMVFKMITDLERMGDKAEHIASMALRLADHRHPRVEYEEIESMGERALGMLRDALDAFERLDAATALRVPLADWSVDRQYEAITRQQLTYMMEDPRTISRGLDLMRVSRALERIGDHSRNICEYVIYLVKGKDVRHISLEEMEEIVHPPR